ncbi:thioredoxin family protein [Haladaptatus caseinilyticus]|uniref:thioredoxin family protein n=1 Tax=Haladaptatus caseinilyticus TaxID=2993314 RepID=UPI00224A8CA3|nr:thioredoxin family protein [Haladaptatus caseinilyticus]
MATIEIFTSDDCGQCETVIERAEEIVEESDAKLQIHNVTEDRSTALNYGIFSVPTTVVDEEVTLRGVPSYEELRDAVEN